MRPTDEQWHCFNRFLEGHHLAIEAGAGTGKTSTLQLLGEGRAMRNRRGQYLAFNKAIVEDAKKKMPSNVQLSTMHSLAFRSVGRSYAHRLRAERMTSMELASRLDVSPMEVSVGGEKRVLRAPFLASLAMRTITERFCHSMDAEPKPDHIPRIPAIDLPDDEGRPTFWNNNQVREFLFPTLGKIWKDLRNPQGQLPFKHDHYLKIWALGSPVIPVDFILFDEAQDADPLMLSVIRGQPSAQLVMVGDSQQQIYEWRGALNALQSLAFERAFLQQSFRFGEEIAEIANVVLERLGAELRLTGRGREGRVGPVSEADAVLCRSNARAIETVIRALASGKRVHLMGGGQDLLLFVRSAAALQQDPPQRANHPDLACFDDWDAVVEYAASDPQGADLALMVKLINEFGASAIEQALKGISKEEPGVVVASTAHKAKGREWGAVRLADDFSMAHTYKDGNKKTREPSPSELRLLYVACTRAQSELDCEVIQKFLAPEDSPLDEEDNE
jgi:hypothetical protein